MAMPTALLEDMIRSLPIAHREDANPGHSLGVIEDSTARDGGEVTGFGRCRSDRPAPRATAEKPLRPGPDAGRPARVVPQRPRCQ